MGESSLQDGQVLQRVGDAAVVELSDGPVVLPTGGPYVVESRGEVLARDVYVGDVFVLAGQSNMQGSAPLADLEVAGPSVRLFGMERVWQDATEPLHRLWRSPEPVHHGAWPDDVRAQIDGLIEESLGGPTPSLGAGCGVAFANAYVEATGVPVGLIPAAYGGSSLADWSPHRDDGLYGAMIRLVRSAGGRIAGLLWHQGESETNTDDTADAYVATTRDLFAAVRRDLEAPELPVYIAQIGFFPIIRTPEAARLWTAVRRGQVDPEPLGVQGVVATVDMTRSDPIHIDYASLRRLGHRYARLVTGTARTITATGVKHVGALGAWPEQPDLMQVHIRLDGVTGGLRSDGPPAGFSVRSPAGDVVPLVWRVDLDGDEIVVHLAGEPVEGAALYYGWGTGSDTQCTLTDSVDTAVPSFGPLPLP